MNKTLQYYNENADSFCDSTINADMHIQHNLFEKYLKENANILDFGCGAGRDTKYFLEKGYSVSAIDGSSELCKKAKDITGIDINNILFDEIEFEEEFDGIWACASLLHIKFENLISIFNKIKKALKKNGVLYVSFKYGDFQGERKGRYFVDLNEDSLKELINKIPELKITETSITSDVRPNRDEFWLNAIITKTE